MSSESDFRSVSIDVSNDESDTTMHYEEEAVRDQEVTVEKVQKEQKEVDKINSHGREQYQQQVGEVGQNIMQILFDMVKIQGSRKNTSVLPKLTDDFKFQCNSASRSSDCMIQQ